MGSASSITSLIDLIFKNLTIKISNVCVTVQNSQITENLLLRIKIIDYSKKNLEESIRISGTSIHLIDSN